MIIKTLLSVVMQAVTALIANIIALSPNMDLVFSDMLSIIRQIIGISQQALNFCHFIVGDSLIVILAILPSLLIAKYLILPIIDIIRRCIPFVNL